MSRYRSGPRPAFLSIAALGAVVLAAGCSSSASSSGPGSGGSAAPTSVATSSGITGNQNHTSVTNYLQYVGGKAGPANNSLAPVEIGYINQQGGPTAVGLLATNGAEMAVSYINKQLGGVDGHPVKLVTCFIASAEEEGTGCAQKFLADKDIKAVAMGGVVIGVQSFYATLAGKLPVIDGVAALPIDGAQNNTVVLFGDGTHVLGPMGTYATTVLHAKDAVVLYPDDSADSPGALAIEAGLKAAGVKVTMGPYPPTATDLTSVLAATGAASADMVIPYTDASGCVAIAKALIAEGITDIKKVVSAPLCLNGQVAAGMGGDFPKWTYSIASSLFGDTTDPGMPAYETVAAKYTTQSDAPDPWEIVDFGQLLTVDKILNEVGYAGLTPSAILAAGKAFKGPQALGAPSLDCGEFPSAPGICNDQAQFFEYEGHNTWVKAAGWLKPAA
ncbi:MAG TPA: ABC transporter substrate-binding protein [Trebonia sp.]|nr:ABC transporter substrate-binding protein [Trebonia sp.]